MRSKVSQKFSAGKQTQIINTNRTNKQLSDVLKDN